MTEEKIRRQNGARRGWSQQGPSRIDPVLRSFHTWWLEECSMELHSGSLHFRMHFSPLTRICLVLGGRGHVDVALAPLALHLYKPAWCVGVFLEDISYSRTVSDTGITVHGRDLELHNYNPPNPIEMDPQFNTPLAGSPRCSWPLNSTCREDQ